jgi:pseudouridine synthase
MLNPYTKREKVYEVTLDKAPQDEDVQQLSSGVVISTTVQRDKLTKDIRVKTLPCCIKRVGGSSDQPSRKLQFTLTEGRNRQIRKMCSELGFEVAVSPQIPNQGTKRI